MKKMILTYCLAIMASVVFAQEKLNVYIFIAEECPISIYMVKPLKESIKTYGEEVKFTAVFPKKNSTLKSAQQFLDDYDLEGCGILLDNDQHFTKSVGATITPEAVVMNETGEVLYRGRISDAYRAPGKMKHGNRTNELKIILGEIITGKQVTDWKPAVGCFITFHNF